MDDFIIDAEVHLMHPASTEPDFAVGTDEPVRKAIHEHLDFESIKQRMTLEALLESIKTNKIRHCHLMGMSWRHKPWNDANNKYIEECVRRYPNLFSGFYIPNLANIGPAVEEVLELDSSVFIGVKLLPGWQGREINDSSLFALLEVVQDRDLFLMVHTDHLIHSVDGDTPQKLFNMLKMFPDLKILAPHMAGLLCLYGILPKYSKLLENVTYITSVSASMEFVKFAAEINSDNIIFGTDFPFNHCHDQSSQITKLRNMGLSEDVQQKILFKNAERLFGYKSLE